MSRFVLASVLLLGTLASLAAAQETRRSQQPPERTPERLEEPRPQPDEAPQPLVELPPAPLNEFQRFVEESIGEALPLFGMDLFTRVPSTFAPLDRVPVPADYVIGPGDELQLQVWGQLDLTQTLVVDRDGQVFIPQVGAIAVAGLRQEQLPSFLRSAIGRIYHNFDLNVSMGRLRSIQVLIVGDAQRPGTYTVSSLSTLVNALFASGGPASTGSMRRIQLRRGQRLVTEFDIYDLLTRGDASKDAQLLPGDIVFIPPVGSLVAIHGSAKRPAIYELKGETSLGPLVELAGGLTTVAARNEVVIERIFENRMRRVEQFALDEAGLQRQLQDGDIVKVFPISPRFENAVTLRGNVARAGRYQWFEGMRIRDLIPGREHLIAPEHWRRVNVRTGRLSGTGVHADVRAIAVDVNWDYALIQRTDTEHLTSILIPFNLAEAVLNGHAAENHLLQPGDVVTVFAEQDLRVPVEKRAKFVTLEGEMGAAGVYRAEPGETLRDLVRRAGGYTSGAYPQGAEFVRQSVRLRQQEALERFLHEMELEVQRASLEGAEQIARSGEAEARQSRLEATHRLLARLRTTEASGRVVLDFGDSVDQVPAIPLEDGDLLVIPYEPLSISVVGMVYHQGDFLYQPNQSVRDYLQMAGGANRDADAGRVYVIRANGAVVANGSGGRFWSSDVRRLRVEPGDTIVVPHQLYRGQFRRQMLDWAQIVGQFGLGAAAVRVLMR